MKNSLINTLVILSLLQSELVSDKTEDDPNKIESLSYDHYKAKGEIAKKCQLDEMMAYTLRGDAESIGDSNELCPSIEGGQCCGSRDQHRIKQIWAKDRKR